MGFWAKSLVVFNCFYRDGVCSEFVYYAMHGINTIISSPGLCQVMTSNPPLRLQKSA